MERVVVTRLRQPLFVRMSRQAPTHENALRSSRSVMKRALAEIAYYGEDEKCVQIARDAIEHERLAYQHGVMRAVD